MESETTPVQPQRSAGGPARQVVRVLTAVEVGLAGTAAALIFVLVLVQAGQRYLPVDGWTWTGELARYSLVWLTFTAAGVLVTRDGHIALQVVDAIPSERVLRVIHACALLVVAATGAALARECWTLMIDQRNLTTPAMGISQAWIYALPLVGFLSVTVRGTVAAGLVLRHGVPAAQQRDALAINVNGDRP